MCPENTKFVPPADRFGSGEVPGLKIPQEDGGSMQEILTEAQAAERAAANEQQKSDNLAARRKRRADLLTSQMPGSAMMVRNRLEVMKDQDLEKLEALPPGTKSLKSKVEISSKVNQARREQGLLDYVVETYRKAPSGLGSIDRSDVLAAPVIDILSSLIDKWENEDPLKDVELPGVEKTNAATILEAAKDLRNKLSNEAVQAEKK